MLDISHILKVENGSFKVVFYSKENGDTPFLDFYETLTPKMRARVFWTINLLKKPPEERL
ncbi:MAG: hypothetical protein J6P81_07235 [Spirochaetales bacterium]|nr:hypothetical protein [Spirochaetales bacterium]